MLSTKRQPMIQRLQGQRQARQASRPHADRQGSTLLIVMVLLALLSALGVVFYVFAAQERSNSEYYAEAAKRQEDPALSADVLMDWGLQQIIIGTDPTLKNSALWGSRHSLLSNTFGIGEHQIRDRHLFNGQGVVTINDGGNYDVDQDRSGAPDGSMTLYDLNDSPCAHGGFERNLQPGNGTFPQGDVGYSYPDINNLFLSYLSWSRTKDVSGNLYPVVIPTYHRPQYLRPDLTSVYPIEQLVGEDRNYDGLLDAGEDSDSSGTLDGPTYPMARSLRVHPEHIYVSPNSTSATPTRRFITSGTEATTLLGAGGRPFPFLPMHSTYPAAPPANWRGWQGVWSGPTADIDNNGTGGEYADYADPETTVQFDVDNDGDGINEGIWIDMDFPVQEDSTTGKLFVPLYSVTVMDLNALFNLNVHGNVAKLLHDITNPLLQAPFFANDSISASNQGLGPAEVNPVWGLNSRVPGQFANNDGANFDQHNRFYGANPTTWREAANMELAWSKFGRPELDASSNVEDLVPGVFGEDQVLYDNYAGKNPQQLSQPGFTASNLDGDDNGDYLYGSRANELPFGHPLDNSGLGSVFQAGTAANRLLTRGYDFGPFQFLQYEKFTGDTAVLPWGIPFTSGLMTNTRIGAQFADPYEIISDQDLKRVYDDLFSPEELAYLQLSNADVDRLGLVSRVADLFPFNFAFDEVTKNRRGADVRRKFTTASDDRREFNLPVGLEGGSGATFDWLYQPGSGTHRVFPPENTLGPDPFRPEVRQLLGMRDDGQSAGFQRRLNLNKLIKFDASGELVERQVTPHDTNSASATLSAQEVLARQDRIDLARDIYLLLFLVGHPNAGTNVLTTATPYSDDQLEEMAQFAVNYVDALDRDSVMTTFQYDRTPYDTDGWNPASAAIVVHGVEEQQVAFSEGLVIRTAAADDNTLTPQVESTTQQDWFVFLELQNVTPNDQALANTASTSAATGAWRITAENAAPTRLTFQNPGTPLTIAAGSVATISSTSFTTSVTSDFRIDYDNDTPPGGFSRYNLIVPNKTATVAKDTANEAYCDLDTRFTGHSTLFNLAGGTALVTSLTPPTGSTISFLLERRANPELVSLSETDNPWVAVDRIEVSIRDFALQQTETSFDPVVVSTSGDGRLESVFSQERSQPLSATPLVDFSLAAQNGFVAYPIDTDTTAVDGQVRRNSIGFVDGGSGRVNKTSPADYTLRQYHFDRDFASPAELLLLPVRSPRNLTRVIPNQFSPLATELANASAEVPQRVFTAAAKFLRPVDGTHTFNSNRWHRLLEFVEVPTPVNQNLGIGNNLQLTRAPGQINLNMLRHSEVLAGLIDDTRVTNFDEAADFGGSTMPGTPSLVDASGVAARDWWDQFIQTRDASDPLWSNNLHLPGIPGSNPYEPMSTVGTNAGAAGGSLARTLFRTVTNTLDPTGTIGLFELVSGGVSAADPVVRYSVLSKLFNNVTTRSNSFAVFITVKNFQAAEENGAIRIGGPLNDLAEPEYRGFFVVDRSLLEKGDQSGAGFTSFRPFVTYRKIVREP